MSNAQLLLRAKALKMVHTSGFLEEAGLTKSDADMRMTFDPQQDIAFSFDISDCQEHAESLTDYATLYGPVVFGRPFAISLAENGTSLLFAAVDVSTAETAAVDDDEDIDLDDDLDDVDDETVDDSDAIDIGDDEDDEDSEITGATARPGDDKLRVLVSPDMHKQASKLYSVLGDTNNMADYPMFLRDLDSLLTRYGGIQAIPRDPNDNSNPMAFRDEEDAFAAELASLSELIETAKKKRKNKGEWKEGRSGLLSALMSSLSKRDIQSYWDKVLPQKFNDAMKDVTAVLTQKLSDEQDRRSGTEEGSVKAKGAKRIVGLERTVVAGLCYDVLGKKGALEVADLPMQAPPSEPTPLCVMMPLTNGEALQDWAKEQGFAYTMKPEDLHVTVAYSKKPVNWNDVPPNNDPLRVEPNDERTVARLGEQNAVVLHLSKADAAELRDRWQRYIDDAGASWDFEDYLPHITLSWKEEMDDKQLGLIRPYNGPLLFGPERQSEVGGKDGGFDVNKIEHVSLR